MEPWETVRREVLLDRPPWLLVEEHTIKLPNGDELTGWPWVVVPDWSIIAARTPDDRWLCFRQTKYAVEGDTLAPAGGYIDDGETPLEAAKRELLEEMGCEADSWTPLGAYAVDGNRGVGTGNLFFADGARHVQDIDADDLEEQELLSLSRDELTTALLAGEFKVAPWAAVFALALLAVDR